MTLFAFLSLLALDDIAAIGRRCGAHDCCEIADAEIHWPGRESLPQCPRHTAWATHVADAMGFRLHTTPLPVLRRQAEADPSAQRFALMEMT